MHAAPHYDFAHATAALIAIAALLSGLELLAVKQLHEQVRVYAVLSAFAAGYTLLVGVDRVDAALIVLAAWTAVIKVIVIPVAIDRAMLALTAGLAALAFVRAIGMTFLGMPRDRSIRPQAESRSARVGMGLLAVASLAIGVAAPWVVDVLERGMLPVGGSAAIGHISQLGWLIEPGYPSFASISPTVLAVTLTAFAVGAACLRYLASLRRARRVPVWASGVAVSVATMLVPATIPVSGTVVRRRRARFRNPTRRSSDRLMGPNVLRTGGSCLPP